MKEAAQISSPAVPTMAGHRVETVGSESSVSEKILNASAEPLSLGLRLLIATAILIPVGGIVAGLGMFWLLMAGFASDSHSGEIPDSVTYIIAGEFGVLALMAFVPPSLIVMGCRWWVTVVSSIGAAVVGIAASFALFVALAIMMSS